MDNYDFIRTWNQIRNDIYGIIETKLEEVLKHETPPHLAWHICDEILHNLGLMCQYDNCTRKSRARGYCDKHYQKKFRKVPGSTLVELERRVKKLERNKTESTKEII